MDKFNDQPHFNQTSKSWVEFYQHCEVDGAASNKAGYKVYKDVDYALLCSKNGKRKVPRKATEQDKTNFPKAWAAYENRRELQKTHLSLIGLRPSQVKDLERLGIDCLEELVKKDVINYYEPYKQAALFITTLREKNDKEFKSGEHIHQERPEVPRVTSIENSNIDTRTPETQIKENQKENRQEIQSLNFSYSI